ncbi:MAG TPA: hypothetical protein VF683_01035 [Chthoniobacterales bacterium]
MPREVAIAGIGLATSIGIFLLRWFYIALTGAPIAFSVPIVVTWLVRGGRESAAVWVVAVAIVYLA